MSGNAIVDQMKNFNPRSQYRERPACATLVLYLLSISIHAPNTGSDIADLQKEVDEDISIHAPNTGSDCFDTTGK